MKNWTPYIPDHTIKAICWTLIHSLWIGLAVALLTGLVIMLTRKSSAALRYRLLCGILVLFVVSAGVTFWLEMRSAVTFQASANTGHTIHYSVKTIVILPKTEAHLNPLDKVVIFLNQYTNVIFIAWLLFFVLKSLKMISGLIYIQRIRTYKVHDVAGEFKEKIAEFGRQIGIGRAVTLLQSELVKVPVAVGWLKPAILLPMGIILQLPAEQLESILWHELAHIRRRDYLVNILQGLVETIFFFNPALLWLSSLIRAEREACCDDMVLSRMNRKANYLEALLSFGFEDTSRTSLAMSIGSGNQLRDRLKRMVNQENKRLSIVEKVVLAAGLVLLSAFTTMPKTTTRAVQNLIHVITKKHDTVAAPKVAMIKPAILVQPAHDKQRLLIEDTTVKKAADTTMKFVSILFKDGDADLANSNLVAVGVDGKRYHLIVTDNKLVSMEIDNVAIDEALLPNYQYMVRNIDRTIAEKRMVSQDDIAYAKANSPGVKYKSKTKFLKKRYIDTGQLKDFNKDFRTFNKLKLYGDSSDRFAKPPKSFNLGGQDWKPFSRTIKSGVMLRRMQDDSASYAMEEARAKGVIADLVADKVVPKASDVKWFGLSDTEFIVNGQKQLDALQQKFKAKYGVHENYGLYYGPAQMAGRGVFIDDEAHPNVQMPTPLQVRLKQQQFMASDMRLKQQPQSKLWSPNAKLSLQQRNLAGLDMQRKEFFKSNIPLNDIITNVTDDLVSRNVIKDKSELASFKLTNKFLMVNGKRQSNEIHEKLKNKYLSEPRYELTRQIMNDPNFGMHYDAKSGSMGLGIDIDSSDPEIK
jgi:bla regulator protein blaR1